MEWKGKGNTYAKLLTNLTEGALDGREDLSGLTPKQFIQKNDDAFGQNVPKAVTNKCRKSAGKAPFPSKAYGDFNFSDATR